MFPVWDFRTPEHYVFLIGPVSADDDRQQEDLVPETPDGSKPLDACLSKVVRADRDMHVDLPEARHWQCLSRLHWRGVFAMHEHTGLLLMPAYAGTRSAAW